MSGTSRALSRSRTMTPAVPEVEASEPDPHPSALEHPFAKDAMCLVAKSCRAGRQRWRTKFKPELYAEALGLIFRQAVANRFSDFRAQQETVATVASDYLLEIEKQQEQLH